MANQKAKSVEVHRKKAALFAIFIFIILVIGLIFPLLAPFFGIFLIVVGIYIYRKSSESAMRTVAILAIGIGVMVLLITILVGVTLFATNRSVEVINGVYEGPLPTSTP